MTGNEAERERGECGQEENGTNKKAKVTRHVLLGRSAMCLCELAWVCVCVS